MTESAKKVWVQIRAELIVTWHDINNPNMFIGGYSYDKALDIAKHELELDLLTGELRISIEDLLLKSDIECLDILHKRNLENIKKLVAISNKK